jgi:hypothetical protein
MGAGFAVPEALRDESRSDEIAPWFAPPVEQTRPPWLPPAGPRGAETLACFDGYAEPTQSFAPEDVDPVEALEDHFAFENAMAARESYDACIAREQRLARINCRAGMFPDGREYDRSLEECMSMWVDGIDDETRGQAHTKGSAHTGGGGIEFGPEVFKVNLGYEHSRSSEDTTSRERTSHGVAGTKERCMRERDQRLEPNRRLVER